MSDVKPARMPITHWPKGVPERILTGATGFMTVFLALRTADFSPDLVSPDTALWEVAIMRTLAFAALTIWATFTIGIPRRGISAMIVMIFALTLEWIIMPIQGHEISFSGAAASGIGLAYLSFHFYWRRAMAQIAAADLDVTDGELSPAR